jgi:hypothetical protein
LWLSRRRAAARRAGAIRSSWRSVGSTAAALLCVALLQPALVKPGLFDAGGFASAPAGFVRLAIDPIRAALGCVLGLMLVLIPRAMRTPGTVAR